MFVSNRGKLGWVVVMHGTDIDVSLYHHRQTGSVLRPILSSENELPYFLRFIGRFVKLTPGTVPELQMGARARLLHHPFQCLLTYILTPWRRVLQKLTGSQSVNKFPAFYATRRFITGFTSARHLSLS
jgi:hypothetical protein